MNTTNAIEAIKEAVTQLDQILPDEYWKRLGNLRAHLRSILSSLQEEPKEQKSGYINADYLRTAIRDRMRTALADTRIHNDAIEAYREVARCIDELAPAPVKEPEDELDEFEAWLTNEIHLCDAALSNLNGEDWHRCNASLSTHKETLAKYREVRKQQGAH